MWDHCVTYKEPNWAVLGQTKV